MFLTTQKPMQESTQAEKGKTDHTGIPNPLKTRMETQSGISLEAVRIHYNSDKPKKVNALAYAMGEQVYLGPGQQEHLPHELGHVIQQKLGLVKPSMQIGSLPINNDPALERDADAWGNSSQSRLPSQNFMPERNNEIIQRVAELVIVIKPSGLYTFEADTMTPNRETVAQGDKLIVDNIEGEHRYYRVLEHNGVAVRANLYVPADVFGRNADGERDTRAIVDSVPECDIQGLSPDENARPLLSGSKRSPEFFRWQLAHLSVIHRSLNRLASALQQIAQFQRQEGGLQIRKTPHVALLELEGRIFAAGNAGQKRKGPELVPKAKAGAGSKSQAPPPQAEPITEETPPLTFLEQPVDQQLLARCYGAIKNLREKVAELHMEKFFPFLEMTNEEIADMCFSDFERKLLNCPPEIVLKLSSVLRGVRNAFRLYRKTTRIGEGTYHPEFQDTSTFRVIKSVIDAPTTVGVVPPTSVPQTGAGVLHGEMILLDGLAQRPEVPDATPQPHFMGGSMSNCLLCELAIDVFNKFVGHKRGIRITGSGGHNRSPQTWYLPDWLINNDEAKGAFLLAVSSLKDAGGKPFYQLKGRMLLLQFKGSMSDTHICESSSDEEDEPGLLPARHRQPTEAPSPSALAPEPPLMAVQLPTREELDEARAGVNSCLIYAIANAARLGVPDTDTLLEIRHELLRQFVIPLNAPLEANEGTILIILNGLGLSGRGVKNPADESEIFGNTSDLLPIELAHRFDSLYPEGHFTAKK